MKKLKNSILNIDLDIGEEELKKTMEQNLPEEIGGEDLEEVVFKD
jgi:hypothetical protein